MIPVKHGAVRHAGSTTLGLGRLGRQQRGDEGPQFVADKRFGHAPSLPCHSPVLIGALRRIHRGPHHLLSAVRIDDTYLALE